MKASKNGNPDSRMVDAGFKAWQKRRGEKTTSAWNKKPKKGKL